MRVSARFSRTATTKYTQTQTATLGKSLLWGGGGFVLVGLVAFLISYFASGWNNPNYNIVDSVFNGKYQMFYGIFWTIALIGMIVGSILMMTWSFNITNVGWTRIIITYFAEILFWGCSFGIIMGMYDGWEVAMALGLTGIIFLLMGIVGSIMSIKVGLTLAKIIGIGIGVLFLVNLFFWLVVGFGFMSPAASGFETATNIWWMITVPLFTLFAMGYVAVDFFMISKSPFFVMQLEPCQARKVETYYGIQLMTDFSYLLYWILMLFGIFSND